MATSYWLTFQVITPNKSEQSIARAIMDEIHHMVFYVMYARSGMFDENLTD